MSSLHISHVSSLFILEESAIVVLLTLPQVPNIRSEITVKLVQSEDDKKIKGKLQKKKKTTPTLTSLLHSYQSIDRRHL